MQPICLVGMQFADSLLQSLQGWHCGVEIAPYSSMASDALVPGAQSVCLVAMQLCRRAAAEPVEVAVQPQGRPVQPRPKAERGQPDAQGTGPPGG